MDPVLRPWPPDPAAPPGLFVARGVLGPWSTRLLAQVGIIAARAPFRTPLTPKGNPMRLESTSCGPWGLIGAQGGYQYRATDPQTGKPWPAMPDDWVVLATHAASQAGFAGFVPDSCLVNRYAPGASLGLHQDKDEPDVSQPIVSVSLGVSCTFLWGGRSRTAPPVMVPLEHGDVVVWGGKHRLAFHGVMPLPSRPHPQWGAQRVNLTFRRAR